MEFVRTRLILSPFSGNPEKGPPEARVVTNWLVVGTKGERILTPSVRTGLRMTVVVDTIRLRTASDSIVTALVHPQSAEG
jgi:hypothetical protein